MKLNNTINHEEYKVFIIPGCVTINWSNLQKIKQFYDNGGQVIATGTLPSKSAEFGHDTDVANTVKAMFPVTGQTLKNAAGGSAVSLGTATASKMLTALDNAVAAYDVQFEPETGGLRYIHKVLNDSLNIYFFGNNSAATISTYARMRGNFTPQQWDPHTGQITTPQFTLVQSGGTTITRVPITLTTLHSVFITGAYTGTSSVQGLLWKAPQPARLNISQSSRNNVLITYFVPQGTRDLASISLQAYNVKGARVAVLLDRSVRAGTYSFTWATQNVPAGTYIVRMKVDGGGVLMRKAIIE
jgi:hypothetical protein